MSIPLRTAVLAVAVLALPAHAEVVDIDWGGGGRFERTLSLPAGKFAELCGKLAKGDRVQWTFTADQPVDFNIHYHVGKEVVYPAKRDGAKQLAGEFVAPMDQDYCWMWSRKSGPDAKAQVTLKR